MAYRFQVNRQTCINCGICMDLCPVRCLDMTRPSGEGEIGAEQDLRSPIPGPFAERPWMMLVPVQVAQCVGCQVCVQECPTNAITIESSIKELSYAKRGPVAYLPPEHGWQPLDAYTRANPEEPGETPWGEDHTWHVAERKATWQSWRTWLGERKEDLRAPCQAACPVGTNAGLYVSLIAEGRYDEALHVASEPNPFPAICGRVCTAPCEDACRRGEFDLPIAIRDLKRFATDHGTPMKRRIAPPKHKYLERVAIIGAGPTGLSAAYYLARRGYSVTVFDAMPVAGGMMAIGIPDYRLPRTELNRDIDAIRELGVELRLNTAIGRDIGLDDLQRDYDAVLIAVGAQRSQRLGIPGEGELKGVIPATTFLKDFNLDPNTRLKGEVAVVGGGSTAMDAARSALRAGANKIHILYRRSRVEMPAQAEEVRAALAEGIELHELVTPVQILSSDGHVHAVRCQRMALSDPDEKGRRRPVPVLGTEFDLPVDIVLVAIGEAPDPSFLPEGTSVGVAPWGGLLINQATLATGAPGVFAAGDVTYGPKSIIHAAAHGRKAARSIHAYLAKIPPHMVHEMPVDEFETESTLPPDGRITLDLRPTPREIMPLRNGGASHDRSIEFATGFTEEQARREASRCLRCDLAYLCPSIHVISAGTPVSATKNQ
ncbi:MAG TPA: FAD-dependent oxidoreductase [Ktedonobacteraceae bacterium]|jgi:NADPH-dependent glutamate synthase beta subunit-like oxidoreductase/NAD-dependent dihydropyrimidine dehydrogenase PreA subunit|nr:FAD-dependent oxidoreductase [Ktedonobacteraceae bacterium]